MRQLHSRRPLRKGEEFYTVRDFCKLIGMTRQRLFQLWLKGEGPESIRTHFAAADGHKRVQIAIPKAEGLDWWTKRVVAKRRAAERAKIAALVVTGTTSAMVDFDFDKAA